MASTVTRGATVPLEGAIRARIHLHHGGGQLNIRSGSNPAVLLGGDLGERAETTVRRGGEQVDVDIRATAHDWTTWLDPATWGGARRPFDWDVELNPNVQLALEIETGASQSRLDLSALRATAVSLRTGASSTEMTVPSAAGFTAVEIHAGLAEVTVRIPPGVAANVQGRMGMAALNVNQARFPSVGNGFESPDFATATNRVQLRVEGGLGTVNVT